MIAFDPFTPPPPPPPPPPPENPVLVARRAAVGRPLRPLRRRRDLSAASRPGSSREKHRKALARLQARGRGALRPRGRPRQGSARRKDPSGRSAGPRRSIRAAPRIGHRGTDRWGAQRSSRPRRCPSRPVSRRSSSRRPPPSSRHRPRRRRRHPCFLMPAWTRRERGRRLGRSLAEASAMGVNRLGLPRQRRAGPALGSRASIYLADGATGMAARGARTGPLTFVATRLRLRARRAPPSRADRRHVETNGSARRVSPPS